MYHKIKNNHLYLFIVRIFAVFIFSTIAWLLSIYFYQEYKISEDIHSKMKTKQAFMKDKIDDIDFVNKNKNYYQYIDTLKLDMVEHKIVLANIYNSKKEQLSEVVLPDEMFKYLSEKIDNLPSVAESHYEIISAGEENIYLYYQDKFKINSKYYYANALVKLDDKTVNTFKTMTEGTLYILLSTMFIVFLSIFPIVRSQYNNMFEKQNELMTSNINTLKSLGNAIAKRDSDTNEHNYRVTYYSIKMAQKLQLPLKELQALVKGAFLHDIGKIAISDNILLKPGKLTTEEFDIMKTHVTSGIDIVANDGWLNDAQKVILNHHEKMDGTGYPNALKGDAIPIEARIFAVADVFDALTSHRPYKKAFSLEKSMMIIKSDSGTHFDEDIVECFEEIHLELFNAVNGKSSKDLELMFQALLRPYFMSM